MKRTQVLLTSLLALVVAGILAILLAAAPVPNTHTGIAGAPQKQEKKEVTVWVNTRSGVYHCSGSRWYGKTKQGKYMGECEAIKDGNRPAYGKPCGSDCKSVGGGSTRFQTSLASWLTNQQQPARTAFPRIH